jgi:hypothetical protein
LRRINNSHGGKWVGSGAYLEDLLAITASLSLEVPPVALKDDFNGAIRWWSFLIIRTIISRRIIHPFRINFS